MEPDSIFNIGVIKAKTREYEQDIMKYMAADAVETVYCSVDYHLKDDSFFSKLKKIWTLNRREEMNHDHSSSHPTDGATAPRV